MTITILGSELEYGAWKAGKFSHAEGYNTVATGVSAHAEGDACAATGTAAHAEGTSTTASGSYAHAEGNGTAAQGFAAHAEGNSSFSSGSYGHAEGISCGVAGAIAGHAEGSNSYANAHYAHAGGVWSRADSVGSWARSSVQPSAVSANRAQVGIYNMAVITTNTAYTAMTFDASTATVGGTTQNVLYIPTYANYLFNLTLTARRPTLSGSSQGWVYNGLVARDSGAARMVGSATQVATWNDGSSLGTPEMFVDTTANYFRVRVSAVNTGATHWHGVLIVNEFASTS